MAIADRLAVMRAGEVVQVGDAESLYRTPGHPFVAEFLGRVNRIARSDADRQESVVRIGGERHACPTAHVAAAELLLRPEDITLTALPAGASTGAEVSQRVFLGGRVHLHVQANDESPLAVDVAKDSPWRVGDRVRLVVDAARLMAA